MYQIAVEQEESVLDEDDISLSEFSKNISRYYDK